MSGIRHELDPKSDWMLDKKPSVAAFYEDKAEHSLVLTNGIVARKWYLLNGAFGCTSLSSVASKEELIRAVRPEALFKIDGKNIAIGGMVGQPDHAFLDPEWLTQMKQIPGSFVFDGFRTLSCEDRIQWATLADRRSKWSGEKAPRPVWTPA